jgi:hypothetical protein
MGQIISLRDEIKPVNHLKKESDELKKRSRDHIFRIEELERKTEVIEVKESNQGNQGIGSDLSLESGSGSIKSGDIDIIAKSSKNGNDGEIRFTQNNVTYHWPNTKPEKEGLILRVSKIDGNNIQLGWSDEGEVLARKFCSL